MKKIKEIQRIDKIPEDKFSYIKFVDKAAADAAKKPGNVENYDGLDIMWAETKNLVRIIAYMDKKPAGYLALKKFKDAYKVYTIGVKPEFRGKGIASTLYDYAISENANVINANNINVSGSTYSTNFSTGNAVISGGSINGTSVGATTGVVTGLTIGTSDIHYWWGGCSYFAKSRD
mgnify:CR=1 FL=1